MGAKEILKWNFVDPERIAVWGWSGGGSSTLNRLGQYPEIYKTGISIAPVTNQLFYDNIYQERYMGLPQENKEDFIKGSPVSYVKNLKGNFHTDTRNRGTTKVHYQNTEAIYQRNAAVGIGIDVEEPVGNMIIDIGGGTTEIAVIALSGIVCDQSIRVAGDNFDSDIKKIKIEVGAALPELQEPPEDFAVQGRDLMTGIPKQITVSYTEIAHCLDKSISKIEEAILKALEITPPELSADIYQTGIYLTGGGALLRAEDPLRAVVRGTGTALKNIGKFKFLMQ
ncbi:hypothetical protein FQR65_LT17350 [Abscondita terminalis]|nr:hypothetical protein FQR65_LT17350 [Abscondita terminalis]